jgi:hypothetical protein
MAINRTGAAGGQPGHGQDQAHDHHQHLRNQRQFQVHQKGARDVQRRFRHQIPAQEGLLDLAVVEQDHLHQEETDQQRQRQAEDDQPGVAGAGGTGARRQNLAPRGFRPRLQGPGSATARRPRRLPPRRPAPDKARQWPRHAGRGH